MVRIEALQEELRRRGEASRYVSFAFISSQYGTSIY